MGRHLRKRLVKTKKNSGGRCTIASRWRVDSVVGMNQDEVTEMEPPLLDLDISDERCSSPQYPAHEDEADPEYIPSTFPEEIHKINDIESEDKEDMVIQYALKHALSITAIRDLECLIWKFTGKRYANLASNVVNKMNRMYKEIIRFKYNMCPICSKKCTDSCSNSTCSMFRIEQRKCKEQELVSVRIFTMKDQIVKILQLSIGEIIKFHSSAHKGMDILPYYQNCMESFEEFETKKMKIPMCIGYDSFVPEDVSTKSHNMFYGKILEIDNFVLNPVILIASQTSRKKLSTESYTDLCQLIRSELAELEEEGLKISVNGKEWVISIVTPFAAADLLGQREGFGLPMWTSPNGCFKCHIVGVKDGRLLRFNNHQVCPPKSKQFYERDGGINDGMFNLFVPSDCICDRLHSQSEGVLKAILSDFFSAHPSWMGRRLTAAKVIEIENSLKTYENYCYETVSLCSLAEFNSKNSSEIEKLCSIVLPLVCSEHMIGCPVTLVHLYAVAYFVYHSNNPSMFEACERIGHLMAAIHDKMSRNFTILFFVIFSLISGSRLEKALRACLNDNSEFDLFEASACLIEHQMAGNDVKGIIDVFCKEFASDIDRVVDDHQREIYSWQDGFALLKMAKIVSTNISLTKKVKFVSKPTESMDTSLLPSFRWSSTNPDQSCYIFESPFKIPEEALRSWVGDKICLESNVEEFVEIFLRHCTDPVDEILGYTGASKNNHIYNYKQLPRDVQAYIRDCVCSIFGFDEVELTLPLSDAKANNSRFYCSLGTNEESRENNFRLYQIASDRYRGDNFRSLLVRVMQSLRRCVPIDGKLIRKK